MNTIFINSFNSIKKHVKNILRKLAELLYLFKTGTHILHCPINRTRFPDFYRIHFVCTETKLNICLNYMSVYC